MHIQCIHTELTTRLETFKKASLSQTNKSLISVVKHRFISDKNK